MPISLICSGCKKSLKVAENLAGKRAKCPGCQTPITIPTPPAPHPVPPPTKKAVEEWDLSLAPLDSDPISKPTISSKKLPAASSKTTDKKPATASSAKPKEPVLQAPVNDFANLELAPLAEDLFADTKPSKAKPTPAASTKPTTPPALTAQPKTPTAKNTPEDILQAPLEDDLFGNSTSPAAKATPTTAATSSKTSAIPASPSSKPTSYEEDEEQDFNLQPVTDLTSDPLNSLGTTLGATGTTPTTANGTKALANPTNICVRRRFDNRFPIGSTLKEVHVAYFSNLGQTAFLGAAMLFIEAVGLGIAYGILIGLPKLIITLFGEPDYITASYIITGEMVTLGIGLFFLQCWIVKTLAFYGYCLAQGADAQTDKVFESPGSLFQFSLVCLLIGGILFSLVEILFLKDPDSMSFGNIVWRGYLIIVVGNLLSLSLFFIFEPKGNFLTAIQRWWREILPHALKYTITQLLFSLIVLIVVLLLAIGLLIIIANYGKSIAAYLKTLSSSRQSKRIVQAALAFMLVVGSAGTYLATIQGVCFLRMTNLSRSDEE